MGWKAALFFAVLAGVAPAAGAGDWDVSRTGDPQREVTFALDEGSWMSLDVSPDGRVILFDLLGDIYSMPASGGAARLVHGGPAIQRNPVFSPDGKRILYISDASGSDNVWVSDSDGGNARQITAETIAGLTGPAWGPDGYVVAARLPAGHDHMRAAELRLFHADGGAGRVIVPAPTNGEHVHEAEFSPDGRYLYYSEKVVPSAQSTVYVDANHINYAIKRRELETGRTEEVVAGFGGAMSPRISPDGKKLAFVRRVKEKTVLFSYDIGSREQRPVFDGLERDGQADFLGQGAYYPRFAWFPDSRHLAIWAGGKLHRINMESGARTDIPFEVTARHQITEAPRFRQDLAPETFTVKAIRQIAPSPDGRTLVFHALGKLWRKTLPDGKPARLTAGNALEFEPAWSADGKWLAYVEWDDERGGALKVMGAAGGNAQTIVTSRGILRQPAFAPDGRSLVYKIEEGDKCIGGFGARPGLYLVSRSGGDSRFLNRGGDRPQFSPDGTRIYYGEEEWSAAGLTRHLRSMDRDGHDIRAHAIAEGPDRLDISISPDLRWIAFKENQQYHVTPYRETGRPMQLTASATGAPVARLTDIGGYDLTWTPDGKIYWSLGDQLYHARAGGAAGKILATIGLTAESDRPNGVLAFTNGRIITMRGDEVIEGGTLVVTGNRITAVGTSDAVAVPANAKVIDMTGKTIMPGLVNMHGHLEDCYYTSSGLMAEKQPAHYASLAYGVTTNYDPYASELPSYAVSEMNKAGVMTGPRAISVGSVIFGREGKVDATYVPIMDLDDARAVMARKQALGGAIIKSYRQPMRSQRQQLIAAARAAEIMVDAEGESNFYFNLSMILDGHTALEHNLPLANYYDDIVQLMAHGGTAHTPTLIATFGEFMGENYIYQTSRTWDDPRLTAFVPETTSSYSPLGTPHSAPPHVRGLTSIHVAEELWDVGFRSVARSMKKLDDAGVLVNAGSHGQVQGAAMHWEMWLMAEGGMSNHRVLRAATLNGARTLAVDDQIGSLEPGKLADLVVMDANPLDDIRNSIRVSQVLANGRLYDAFTMNETGNHDRPRGKFFWELEDYPGLQWNETWAHH